MKKILLSLLAACGLAACTPSVTSPEQVERYPEIYPDYIGVTVPATIAPLNFDLAAEGYDCLDVTLTGGKSGSLHVSGAFASFPLKKWHALLEENAGDSLRVSVCARQEGRWKQFRPFAVYVSSEPIDYGLVYRKIAPGYEVYSKMGIYERNLSNFDERPLMENTLVPGMCLNCHSLNRTDPSCLSLHLRGEHGGTWMQAGGRQELLDTKTDSTLSACVYPYWHPGGEYIAYSVNNTRQSFHVVREERIEVMDLESDVLVYHPATHELLLSPLLQRKEVFETFPAFSADGKTLYFCASQAQPVPEGYKEIRYDLCSIGFDPAGGTFGNRIDTLLHASAQGKSISFPRPSYDGRFLMYTLSDYGNFSIWHREADLWLLDLQDGSTRPLAEANSPDTESFHNWSGNSRWFVFSSRRGDGLYTRLYLAHIDAQGHVSKPFLLPQKHPRAYYDESVYSYNVPDFTSKPVELDFRQVERRALSAERVPVKVRSSR